MSTVQAVSVVPAVQVPPATVKSRFSVPNVKALTAPRVVATFTVKDRVCVTPDDAPNCDCYWCRQYRYSQSFDRHSPRRVYGRAQTGYASAALAVPPAATTTMRLFTESAIWRLPDALIAKPLGVLRSVPNPVMLKTDAVPAAVTSTMRLLLVSAIKRLHDWSRATSWGELRVRPVVVTADPTPAAVMFTMRLLPESAT
jgi:hypothetical protein